MHRQVAAAAWPCLGLLGSIYCSTAVQVSGFLPVHYSARSRGHSSALLLDRSAGSKTDPIEMTVIDRAPCAVDLARYSCRIHWATATRSSTGPQPAVCVCGGRRD
eukprot:SAG25_NODE_384_length_8785_cov_7.011628_11_plen_105_part_00